MKRSVLVFLGICLIYSQVMAQADKQKRPVFVVVPRETGLAVIASQPDCPMRFEEVKFVRGVNGGERIVLRLRNSGTKPVSSVTFAMSTSHGGAWMSSWPERLTSELIMPGQIVPLGEDESDIEIIPLTDDLRDKLKLRGPMQAVAVFMIVRVKFADGSTYDDESTYKALQAYFDELAAKAQGNTSVPPSAATRYWRKS